MAFTMFAIYLLLSIYIFATYFVQIHVFFPCWSLYNQLKIRLDLVRNLNWDCRETNPASQVLGAGFELGACALSRWPTTGVSSLWIN